MNSAPQLSPYNSFFLPGVESDPEGRLTVPLETALRLFNTIQGRFPELGPLQLPIAAVVEATDHLASSQYRSFIKRCLGLDPSLKAGDMPPDLRERYMAYTLNGLPGFDYYLAPVPNVDELRSTYPEGSYPRYLLDLELGLVRVEVKKALGVLRRKILFAIEDDSSPLEILKNQLESALAGMGIALDPTHIRWFEVSDGEIVDGGRISLGEALNGR